jgi:PleD family two-component response regulator
VKGGAGMMNQEEINLHLHKMEEMFQMYKNSPEIKEHEIYFFLNGIEAALNLLDGKEVEFDYQINNEKNQSQETSRIKKEENNNSGVIFLIDDEEDVLESLEIALEETNFKIETFLNPLDALEKINPRYPDLIITDLKMPQISGLDLVKKVKEIN